MTVKELLRNDIENADELLTLAGVMHRRAARLGKVIDYATNKNSVCIESVLKTSSNTGDVSNYIYRYRNDFIRCIQQGKCHGSIA